jgi:hypothetical protein
MKLKTKYRHAKKRARQIVYMILALGIFFAGVPYGLHLITAWNGIAPEGNYVKLKQADFTNHTLENWLGEDQGDHIIVTALSDGSLIEQDTILWDDNTTGNHSIVISGVGSHYGPYWITPWNIQDLITNQYLQFRIDIVLPKVAESTNTKLRMYYYDETDDVITITGGAQGIEMGSKSLYGKSNGTFYFNTTTLDLMVDKAEYGNRRVAIFIDNMQVDTWDPADVIEFDFYYYKKSSAQSNDNLIMKIGAGVIGIVLILMGVASTSQWNPAPGSKPGRIDKWLSSIGKRTKRRRRK